LFSLYVLDVNSAAASAKVRRAVLPLLLTDVGRIEILNAVGLRLFRKELLPSAAAKVYDFARKYTPHLGTGTLDVLHVAGALALKARAFYTFDNKQAKLAFTLGLRIL